MVGVRKGCVFAEKEPERVVSCVAVLPRRWVVERTLSWSTGHRRHARDHERRPDRSRDFLPARVRTRDCAGSRALPNPLPHLGCGAEFRRYREKGLHAPYRSPATYAQDARVVRDHLADEVARPTAPVAQGSEPALRLGIVNRHGVSERARSAIPTSLARAAEPMSLYFVEFSNPKIAWIST